MKFLISLAIVLSLLFLFGGLFSVSIFGDRIKTSSDSGTKTKITANGFIEKPNERLTMQQIDSISSAANYSFTMANAESPNQSSVNNTQ
ncbi:MAG: hypothetical protein ACYCVH_13805 [Ignavibacteriaceae bacterium]